MTKLPAFQFYPADWRKDPGVQSLGYFERGVWFEILCLMHESEQRGKLLLNGKPMPNEALARLLGLDKQILTKTLSVLIEYGVASYDNQSALISRRMVKDEQLRKIRTEAGKKGGNPNLVNQNSTKTKKQVNQNSTPSSSSSLTNTFSSEKDIGGNGNSPPKETQDAYLERKQLEYPHLDVQAIFKRYIADCKKKGIPPKRPFFDSWLDNEFEPLTADFVEKSDLPTSDEVTNERERFRQNQKLESPTTAL